MAMTCPRHVQAVVTRYREHVAGPGVDFQQRSSLAWIFWRYLGRRKRSEAASFPERVLDEPPKLVGQARLAKADVGGVSTVCRPIKQRNEKNKKQKHTQKTTNLKHLLTFTKFVEVFRWYGLQFLENGNRDLANFLVEMRNN